MKTSEQEFVLQVLEGLIRRDKIKKTILEFAQKRNIDTLEAAVLMIDVLQQQKKEK